MEVPLLNKFEKRDLVIKLHKEGRTYSEIAHIAHVSVRDIKPILKKYERKLESETKRRVDNQAQPIKKISRSSRAYELLLQGKTPVEVAIELNLGFEEARKYWTEFLRLQGMKKLYNIYVYNECHLDYVLKIYYFLLRNNIDFKNFENVLNVAYDITKLYQTRSTLLAEIEKLKQTKNNYQNFSSQPVIEYIPNPGPTPYGIPPITWRFRTRTNNPF